MSRWLRLAGMAARRARDWARVAAWDAAQNRRWVTADERVLVVRDPTLLPHFYDLMLDWLALHQPEARARFELATLPVIARDWSRVRAVVPWLQDPVEAWSRTAAALARRLEAECARRGVPILNAPSRLLHAAKSEGARRIATVGLRTPRMTRLEDPRALRDGRAPIPYPLFVREDWGHRGDMLRADDEAAARAIDVGAFERPVAIELVDVRSPDGLFRKYRYVVAGEVGVPQSMHVGGSWCVRGTATIFSEALRDEEVAFTRSPLPEHERLVAAREALGLDFVAFDFSRDRDGRMIVWEANPYPLLHYTGGRRRYRQWPTTRVLAAMARLYLGRAGLPIPPALDDVIAREA